MEGVDCCPAAIHKASNDGGRFMVNVEQRCLFSGLFQPILWLIGKATIGMSLKFANGESNATSLENSNLFQYFRRKPLQ